MIVGKFLVGLSFLSVLGLAHSGYNSLSEAIMSSMTNLWNETQSSQSSRSIENSQDWWDNYDDSISDSESSVEQHPQHLIQMPSSSNIYLSDNKPIETSKKSDYSQFPGGRRRPLAGKKPLISKKIKQPVLKSSRKGLSPLLRSLHHSQPISFEELLHYYDYLDDYSDESCSKEPPQTKPNFTNTVESMLNTFISKLTGMLDRPVVVHANVCCSSQPSQQQSPIYDEDATNLLATNNVTETPVLQTPHYIINTTDRYAANHDIVKQMKEQYEKVLKLMSMVSKVNETDTEIERGPTTTTTQSAILSVTPMILLTRLPEVPTTPATVESSTFPEQTAEVSTAQSSLIVDELTTEINPKEAVENITINLVTAEVSTDQITNDVQPDSPGETEAPLNEAPTEIQPPVEEQTTIIPPLDAPIASETPLKRRRRNTYGQRRRPESKRPKTTTINEIPTTTTELTMTQDLEYDDFVKNLLGNKTSLLDTKVLNRSPIVEHIHSHLLNREIKAGIEWQPPKPNCTESKSSSPTIKPAVKPEDVLADPPDFIESIEVKTLSMGQPAKKK